MNLFKSTKPSLSSSQRKKARFSIQEDIEQHHEDELNNNTFRCSTPEESPIELSNEQIKDYLMFIQYHVYSYAIQEYLSILICQNINTNNDIEMTRSIEDERNSNKALVIINSDPYKDLCLSTKSTCSGRLKTDSTVGLLLAKQILFKNIHDEEPQVIRNENTNPFSDEQSYNKFIRKHKSYYSENAIPMDENKYIDDSFVMNQGRNNEMSLQDLNIYLMPEV